MQYTVQLISFYQLEAIKMEDSHVFHFAISRRKTGVLRAAAAFHSLSGTLEVPLAKHLAGWMA